jgi:branched-chain amino acid transport system ATP-binding protein
VTLLELDAISSYYGDLQALFGISLDVVEGETAAIIGSNGAGKSTLLRVVAGLTEARAGDIRFDGASIRRVAPHLRVGMGISLVPEGRRVFPSLTVEENLRIGTYRGRQGPWDLAAVYELFPILRERAGRSGAVLSGGEQQALAIGRALMANPRLLLLDEVSLGLAPVIVKQLYEALPSITARGATILLVEQSVDQALAAADRVYCLLEGRISLTGLPAEITRAQITTAYFGLD